MIDHDRQRQGQQIAVDVRLKGCVEIELQMPPERLDPGRQSRKRRQHRRGILRHEVQPDALDPVLVQFLELPVGGGVVDDRDAAEGKRPGAQRRHHGGIVRAVGARLDQHGPRAPEGSQHPDIVGQGRRCRNITGARRQGIAVAPFEDMSMAVAGSRRQAESGGARRGVGREVDGEGRGGCHEGHFTQTAVGRKNQQ